MEKIDPIQKTKRVGIFSSILYCFGGYFALLWRHGRVVRRGTANPFSPVQIRVSPDQQKTQNILFPFADIDITYRIDSQQKYVKEKVS